MYRTQAIWNYCTQTNPLLEMQWGMVNEIHLNLGFAAVGTRKCCTINTPPVSLKLGIYSTDVYKWDLDDQWASMFKNVMPYSSIHIHGSLGFIFDWGIKFCGCSTSLWSQHSPHCRSCFFLVTIAKRTHLVGGSVPLQAFHNRGTRTIGPLGFKACLFCISLSISRVAKEACSENPGERHC